MCNSVEASAAGREPYNKNNEHFITCKAKCCTFCSYCTWAFSKEQNKSRGSRLSIQEKQIKICEKCFLCQSIVLCKSCHKCSQCCHKSACRRQTSNLFEKVVRSGCRSESSTNIEGKLHRSLPDLAKFVKNSHSHKLLWQSSQEPQTVRGITSAYGQKCHRISSQTNLTRVFQPTFSSPKIRQQMETHFGPKQSKSFPQDRKVQDGDTGNHEDISPTRRVGNLHRLQGRLLPHTDTGTFPEILEISHPGPDLPVQSTTIRSVDSAHGVHYHGKGGKADGRSKGYKDPPIPRRLVGESHIPPGLSPTYTGPSSNVPRVRLTGEHRKVGAGTETNFQLCRLPIRPRVRSGPTYTGPVAKPARKDYGTSLPTDLFGTGLHVLDRPLNSH